MNNRINVTRSFLITLLVFVNLYTLYTHWTYESETVSLYPLDELTAEDLSEEEEANERIRNQFATLP